MNSFNFQNNSIFFNKKRSRNGSQKQIFLKNLKINDTSKQMSYNKKFVKEKSMSNIKSINHKNIFKKISLIKNKENKKAVNTKSILPLLNSDLKQKRNPLLNYDSIINVKKMNQFKEYNTKYLYLEYKKNTKYLYLEYKKENSENELDNETKYIEIDPQQIILSLTEYPKIKQIFKNLTKKINKRNISKYKNKSNYDSKINIDKILNNLDKERKNNQMNNINNEHEYDTIYYKNDLNNNSTIFLSEMEYKDNYSIKDLFLLDIINKLIKYAIFLHDKKNLNISEEFMLKEYKMQIKKLKTFFDDKINENKSGDLISITKEGNKNDQSQKCINLREKIYYNDKSTDKNDKGEEIYDNNKLKYNLLFNKTSRRIREKSDDNLLNKRETNIIFRRPLMNLYNFDIGPKINIIDFDELLNKIHRKRLDIKDGNTNIDENILKRILELNKNKIKFGNIMIEEKTKILKNKTNLFMSQNSKYFSRNINNRKFDRKKLFIRNELFNDNKNKINKEKEIESSKKDIAILTKSNETYSSMNDSDYLKVISQKEKTGGSREKINIEKLGIKKDFGITKVGFNKTIDKIRRMHCNKTNRIRKKLKVYNFSFLNTIYGKINTKRKMKINEIDYKEEIRQKGLQLLCNIFKLNPKINKKISPDDICISNKNNHKTFDKGTDTRDILFN